MKIVTWNIKGLNDLSKQREIRSLVKGLKLQVICIIDTRVKSGKVDRIKETILLGWGFVSNYEFHHLGRIWVCWNIPEVKVGMISKSEHVISCKLCAVT